MIMTVIIIIPRQTFLGRILRSLGMLLLVDVSEKLHYSRFGFKQYEKSDSDCWIRLPR
jgi:hypothetical protein